MNLSKTILIGRIASDINSFESKTGVNIVRFSLAITRDNFSNDREDITDFIPIVAFRNLATFLNNYLNKGDLVNVVGSLQSSQYTTKSGDVITTINVVAEQVKQLEPKAVTQARAEKRNTTILNTNENQNKKKEATFYPEKESDKSNSSENDDNPWELDF